ncbi:tripartite tricarboxylate transporter substrate binding protein [Parapusillimonas sp. SGNA-6]|nr:tripartite tricarboxylate transporter substrate binding protein [Parapusillimonas sp. SGNA-6]
MKTTIGKLALLAPLILGSGPAQSAADFPTKPLTLIVPFAPGGSTDTVARIISQKLSEELKQSVVILNKAGANTRIGTELAKRSAADGYTLVLATNGHTSNPVMQKEVSYDPIKDFQPIVYIGATPNVIAANPKSGIKTLQDLQDMARSNPEKVFYATAGQGTVQHLTGAKLDEVAGTRMMHVAYKGGGPAAVDVIAGQVPILISGLPAAIGYIKAGSLTPLAVTSKERSSIVPDVPSVASSGHPGFESNFWFMILAPANTPESVVATLNTAFNKVLQQPEVRKQLAEQGVEPGGGSASDAANMLLEDLAATKKLVQAAGIPKLD